MPIKRLPIGNPAAPLIAESTPTLVQPAEWLFGRALVAAGPYGAAGFLDGGLPAVHVELVTQGMDALHPDDLNRLWGLLALACLLNNDRTGALASCAMADRGDLLALTALIAMESNMSASTLREALAESFSAR